VTVKEKYGVLPLSVMDFDSVPDNWQEVDKRLKIHLKRRSNSCKHLPGLKYSKFSYGLSEFVIKYWSEPGDVILDPFMGWGIRGVVALLLNRNYIGYDISNEMFRVARDFIGRSVTSSLLPLGTLNLYNDDGVELRHTKDDSVDMVFTCPPYFDREKYPGDDARQLSKVGSYAEFLSLIQEALKNCRRVLKKDKFAIWVVGDWRSGGYYLFHNDLINLAKEVGFNIWDVVISRLRSPFAHKQIGKCERMRYTSKVHEYIIVMKK